MSGYSVISLIDMVDELGEDRCVDILSSFSCPHNADVENFLKKKSYAIEFAKQGISQTFLVYASYKKEQVLCGYFSIASNKYIIVPSKAVTKTYARRLRKFSAPNADRESFLIIAPLVAQLGKNFSKDYNRLISGDELLKIAVDKIQEAQRIVGGKVIYVECEDKPFLVDFYTDNGFVKFGTRKLDKDERTDYTDYSGNYLVQLLKYIR